MTDSSNGSRAQQVLAAFRREIDLEPAVSSRVLARVLDTDPRAKVDAHAQVPAGRWLGLAAALVLVAGGTAVVARRVATHEANQPSRALSVDRARSGASHAAASTNGSKRGSDAATLPTAFSPTATYAVPTASPEGDSSPRREQSARPRNHALGAAAPDASDPVASQNLDHRTPRGAEAEQLARAWSLLSSGQPQGALAAIPSDLADGDILAEEWAALRVLATCADGDRQQARALAVVFLRQFSDSPLGARVSASCR
ncbi:MAG: hypothetical protein IPH07_21370 [Deltaproteobacteria bacterium]|nr:hypothetical protein [Deltaproteobacteria bacterium]MBK8714483.1 hypothetical protein [Deltaproteobacteria bacterium]MBP7288243.1 hypothetical protein [Nannocystaceae bacterium]